MQCNCNKINKDKVLRDEKLCTYPNAKTDCSIKMYVIYHGFHVNDMIF